MLKTVDYTGILVFYAYDYTGLGLVSFWSLSRKTWLVSVSVSLSFVLIDIPESWA